MEPHFLATLPPQLELFPMPPDPSHHKPLRLAWGSFQRAPPSGILWLSTLAPSACPLITAPHQNRVFWPDPSRKPSASLGSLRSLTVAGQDVLSRSLSQPGEGRGREDSPPSAQPGTIIDARQGGHCPPFPYRGLPCKGGWVCSAESPSVPSLSVVL